ncbi:MAG: hypothetical protein ACFFAI_09180 [Promethearchaeota archaeon]
MTNLLEKSLLLGFSIILLAIFTSILIPFLNEINVFNNREKEDLDSYTDFFYEIDSAVLYVINNPDEYYQKDIKYPSNLNITFIESFVIFEFVYKEDIFNKVLVYNTSFLSCYYYDITPQIYLLNVSYTLSYLKVDFINLH